DGAALDEEEPPDEEDEWNLALERAAHGVGGESDDLIASLAVLGPIGVVSEAVASEMPDAPDSLELTPARGTNVDSLADETPPPSSPSRAHRVRRPRPKRPMDDDDPTPPPSSRVRPRAATVLDRHAEEYANERAKADSVSVSDPDAESPSKPRTETTKRL